MAGIYFHIPFCKQACHYCNFHFSTNLTRRNEMINIMVREIELRKDFFNKGEQIATIYFGGGTPSITDQDGLGQLLEAVHKNFKVADYPEITLEANPDDLDRHKLKTFVDLGINRLSIGIQSFHDTELRMMNRVHNAQMAVSSVALSQEMGISNITIDLIFGVQNSTEASWLENLNQAIKLEVPHMSCYNLTVEPKTALAHFVKVGKVDPVDDDLSARQFGMTMDVLGDAGYEHYEISNYTRPGFISQHNSNYWRGIPYLGIGPSAHSYDGHQRLWNVSNNALYLKSLAKDTLPISSEELSLTEQCNEYLMTRLRTKWGVDFESLSNFQPDIDWEDRASTFTDQGLLYIENQKFFLTREGKFYADQISSELFV
ncbi:MAG: radical SAM family heme chaperone HemW [Bacteroidia bacterium]|nr:radical SAM family heme chaperone HemW [Bacteroidia bacterium]